MDITADSKYAVVGEIGFGMAYTQIGIWTINPDGSLGTEYDYGGSGGLGEGTSSGYLWLSPDERLLFVTDISGVKQQVTTLNLDESVPNVSYHGCIITPGPTMGGLATALPSGTGTYLYVDEFDNPGTLIALYNINPSNGCLTPVPGLPFQTNIPESGDAAIAARPPRPF